MPNWQDTRVFLCKGIPWDNSYSNVRLFGTETERLDYMSSHIVLSFEYGTYVRETGAIRFPAVKENIQMCNYLYYLNREAGNKWMYAVITRMDFTNFSTTDVYFDTDVFQTWFSDDSIQISCVERETVAQDGFGLYLLDEELQTGEYIRDMGITAVSPSLTPCIYMCASEPVPGQTNAEPMGWFNGTFNGLIFTGYGQSVATLWTDLRKYNEAGKAAAVIAVFMAAREFYAPVTSPGAFRVEADFTPVLGGSVSGVTSSPIDSYTPKNYKCYQYPYRVLTVQADGSAEKIYRYENFTSYNNMFTLFSALTPNSQIIAYPNNYLRQTECTDNVITMSGYPVCSWLTDTYKNWLAQNQMSMDFELDVTRRNTGLGVMGSLVGGLISALSGNVGGVIQQGINIGNSILSESDTIARQNIQKAEYDIIPDSAHGSTGVANSFYAMGKRSFKLLPKCCKREFIERIDNYFSMYGYKVLEMKKPNIHSRQNWNYLKLVTANLIDEIPVEAHNKIKAALERGVTFWHNNNILQYGNFNNPTM